MDLAQLRQECKEDRSLLVDDQESGLGKACDTDKLCFYFL